MSARLSGKVAIVTGATSGIGERTAERFVEEGARVVLSGRSEIRGRAIVARIGKNAVFCRADVTIESDIVKMFEAAEKHFGRLDILFNNAGFSTAGRTPEEITEKDFLYDIKLLVGSVLFGIKHALPLLRKNGGSIINNASIAGMRSGFGPLVYSAAKAAVVQLTRTLAMQLAANKIRVNAISPGAILTPIFGRAMGLGEQRTQETLPQFAEILKNFSMLDRIGTPDDIASAAIYLASDESGYMTGHNLVVDGGVTIGRTQEESTKVFQSLASAGLA